MATILPNGKTQFEDSNGRPLIGGFVFYYQPNTETKIDTWQDIDLTTPNTNPVELDARGQAAIWGNTVYRQVVKDKDGIVVWDEIVSAAASYADFDSGAAANALKFDGATLTQIFQSRVSRVVDSIGTLRSLDSTVYSAAQVSNYYSDRLGGGGNYKVDYNDMSSLDNGGSIIVGNDHARWKLQSAGPFSVKQFGAKGDGSADDSAAFQNAANALPSNGGTIVVPDTSASYIVNTAPVTGTKSVSWEFGPNAIVTGTQTTFPRMSTNQGIPAVGPWITSKSGVVSPSGDATSAFSVEAIPPASLNGGVIGIFAGTRLSSSGAAAIASAANFVATAAAGSSGNIWGLEIDVGNYAGNVGNQFGLSINGLGDYDVTFAIKAQRADNSRYLYGIDLQHTRIGLLIENTTNHENSIVAGLIPTRYPKQTVMLGQLQNSDSILFLQRYTNVSPAGFLINAVNANNTGQLFSVDVNGVLFAAGNLRAPYAQVTGPAVAVAAGSLGMGAATATTASAGSGSLPANPAGFLAWYLGTSMVKIPYYN